METENIYDELSSQELMTLQDLALPHIRSWYIYDSEGDRITISKAWLAIYKEYFVAKGLSLEISSSKYYFRQEDLDSYYPTNRDSMRFAPPFDTQPSQGKLSINFINTTTGVKIYDYAKRLAEDPVSHAVDKPGVAVTLTQNRQHRVKVLINNRAIFVLSNVMNHKFIRQTLSLLPFIVEDELLKKENVLNCCKAVANNQSIKPYVEEMLLEAKKTQQQDFVNCIKEALNRKRNDRLTEVRSKISNIRNYIEDYQRTLNKEREKLAEAMLLEVGLTASPTASEEDVQAIIDFADKNQYIAGVTIKNRNTSDPRIQLQTLAPITFYEPEPLQKFIESRFRDEPYMSDIQRATLKVLEEVFCKEKYTMYCKTFIDIDTANSRALPKFSDNGISISDYDYMIQPHLYLYGCWGENDDNIRKELRDGDLLSAFQLIILAIQNINFTDYTVLRNFILKIKEHDILRRIKTFKSKEDEQWYSFNDIEESIRANGAQEQTEEVGHPELTDEIPNF